MTASSADSGTRMGPFWEEGWVAGGIKIEVAVLHDLSDHRRRPHAVAALGILVGVERPHPGLVSEGASRSVQSAARLPSPLLDSRSDESFSQQRYP